MTLNEPHRLLGVWLHFQGKQRRHFHNCLSSRLGSTLKGKTFLTLEQKSFEGFSVQAQRQIGSHIKCQRTMTCIHTCTSDMPITRLDKVDAQT